ncbi:hypothetical protein F0L74_07560 [Chitinophaga agrisoli]|uniref:HEAT repeat protein n=1 Tax=Chitinophaga agrisoli TaxID=2607653 RepID=A0A5B2VTN0_9BACT|nr:hypothetical protein [Chitinophaga agrisoli]KAA2242395.1 hypothetical protein F0L74_07560 [Chitinophaga agrisoli]
MHLLNEILQEHSREQAIKITAWIGADKARMARLMELFLHGQYRVVQRAAWIMSMVAHKHPELITPHLPVMIQRMEAPGIPVAVKRNVTRVLQFLPIPPDLHGVVMQQCFALLEDPKETIAVRAFSMTVLAKMAKDYPDIKNEIRIILEDQLAHNPSPGIRSRAKKVLIEISRSK